jgi:hypothetical protein
VARRAVRSRDAPSPITIERVTAAGVEPRSSSTLLDIAPPGTELARRVTDATRRAHRHYRMTVGIHHGCDPRRRSVVEHRLPLPAHEIVAALCREEEISVSTPALTLTASPGLTAYDPATHEHRVPASLRLAWSWPALPMWLVVGEVSDARCTLSLSLRSRRRVRYPTRYFHAAHCALTALESHAPIAL